MENHISHSESPLSETEQLRQQIAELKRTNDQLEALHAEDKTEIELLRNKIKDQDLEIVKVYNANHILTGERDRALELAARDPLTDALTRREGDIQSANILSQVARGDISAAYVRFDLDDFKHVNDTPASEGGGHAQGDSVLRQVVDVLKEQMRGSDIIIRFGGDEFDIMMPERKDIHYQDVGNGINRFLDAIRTIYRKSPEYIQKDPSRLTTSIGVVFVHAGEKMTLEEIQDRADKCAYKSKNDGRDKITLYEPQSGTVWQPAKTGETFAPSIA